MVDESNKAEFVSDAAAHICQEHGIVKAMNFLTTSVSGLNPVEQFAICEGKARLRKKSQGDVYVEWFESETDTPEDSNSSETS